MKRKRPKSRRSKKPGRSLKTASVIVYSILLVFALLIGGKIVNKPSCANSISCIKDLSGTWEDAREGVFMGKKVEPHPALAALPVLGTQSGEGKRIEVDLTTQTLRAYDGSTLAHTFPVSTGKWGRTPTGEFRIWIKLRYTRMSGGSQALGTYYNLPNVPYTMYFYNDKYGKSWGYGLHGAYWHNNFGHPMSHGCVNMRPEDAGVIYNWAMPSTGGSVTYASAKNPGTRIIISGTAPRE